MKESPQQNHNFVHSQHVTYRSRSRSPINQSKGGYVILSGPRSSKNRSRNISDLSAQNSRLLQNNLENEHKKQLRQFCFDDVRNDEADEDLPIRRQRPFRPIPKFMQKDLIIRNARETTVSERSVSRKRKISVTRISQKEGSNINSTPQGKSQMYGSSRR